MYCSDPPAINEDLLLITKQSQTELRTYASPNPATAISVTAYTNLIKASWILVDIISCHPQISFLDSGTRYEAQLLAAVSQAFTYSSSQGVQTLT